MSPQLLVLPVIIPLLSAPAISFAGWLDRRLCYPIAALGLGLSALCSLRILLEVVRVGNLSYRMGGWPPPIGIVYEIDALNALVLAVVSVIAFINIIATPKSVQKEIDTKKGAFYTLYVLFITGLMGMVSTGDAFNLYVLLEIASITGYALIALGPERGPISSLNYVMVGTIGASFYLLGVGYLYIMTGSLNMADIAVLLEPMYGVGAVLVAFVILIVGIWIKMAFFPLHGWLPNAYTYAPSAVSSLVAPLMTKVMVYVMIRMALSVFTPQYVFDAVAVADPIVWLSVIAIVMGALFALGQRDLKRMLTYVVVSEVGYMVGGFWLGNRMGMTGAVLHVLNDALMTLCVFLAVCNILYKVPDSRFENLKGLFRTMPFTMGAFTVGALSMIGVPPTCGFFSKWYLLLGAFEAGRVGFAAALIFSSLVNIVIFFRVIEIGFFEPFSSHHDEGHGGRHGGESHASAIDEAPWSMIAPLVLTALGLIVVGLYTGRIVSDVIGQAIPAGIL